MSNNNDLFVMPITEKGGSLKNSLSKCLNAIDQWDMDLCVELIDLKKEIKQCLNWNIISDNKSFLWNKSLLESTNLLKDDLMKCLSLIEQWENDEINIKLNNLKIIIREYLRKYMDSE